MKDWAGDGVCLEMPVGAQDQHSSGLVYVKEEGGGRIKEEMGCFLGGSKSQKDKKWREQER